MIGQFQFVNTIRDRIAVAETQLLPGNDNWKYLNISNLIFYYHIKMKRGKHNRSHIKILLLRLFATLNWSVLTRPESKTGKIRIKSIIAYNVPV